MTGLHVGVIVRRYPLLSQTFVRNEVEELRRQGTTVTVCSLERSGDGGQPPDIVIEDAWTERETQRATARLKRRHPLRWKRFRQTANTLHSELGRGPGRVDAGRMAALTTELQERGVDILHGHFGWHGAAAAWLTSTLLHRPWCMTLHANDIFGRRQHLEEKVMAADRVITVCEYNRRWLAKELGLRVPLEVVVCGVDPPEVADRRALALDVLAVGRLVEKKGFDVLLAAVAQLSAAGRPPSVEIVGEGPLRVELEAQARALGVAEHVRFTGAMPHPAVLERMGAARVFCLPCRVASDGDRDSMPVVIKEAMARGVPVVSTTEVAVPEMVDDSCGRLVAPDDAVGLGHAIAELLDDPALAERLGQAGRSRARERFTLAGEVAKLVQIFEDVTGPSRGKKV